MARALTPLPPVTPFYITNPSLPCARVSGLMTKPSIPTSIYSIIRKASCSRPILPVYTPGWCFRCAFWPVATQWFYRNPNLRNTYTHAPVKRWSKRILGGNLHRLRTLVIPINLSNQHWVCAVAQFPSHTLTLYDSATGSAYDSGRDLLRHVEAYLNDEFRDRHPSRDNPDLWLLVTSSEAGYPQQTNGFDCGVFVCFAADRSIRAQHAIFTPTVAETARPHLALSLLTHTPLQWQ